MKFRPCIDIHNGQVKQIVGGSLQNEEAKENFVSSQNAAWYAAYYKEKALKGGHIILLNSPGTPEYRADRKEALEALKVWPGGFQVGGGIDPDTAPAFLKAGASHVIVTSYLFPQGEFSYGNAQKMIRAVGKEHLVFDLSCRKKQGSYYVVTERWQHFTQVEVTPSSLREFAALCDEILIHGVEAEGKSQGVDAKLVQILAQVPEVPMTYAGGVGSLKDLEELAKDSEGKLDVTVGSALDLFGGPLSLEEILSCCNQR